MFKKIHFDGILHVWGKDFYILIDQKFQKYVLETTYISPNNLKMIRLMENEKAHLIEEATEKDVTDAIAQVRNYQNTCFSAMYISIN